MDALLHRCSEKIKGVIEGFDGIVFKAIAGALGYFLETYFKLANHML